VVVYKAISAGGGMLIGKIITRDLVITLLKLVGVRLTTQQGRQVRAAGRPGGVGRADLFGAEVRVRTAHPAVPVGVAPSWPCRRRTAAA
jgi:hypothetical protein